MTLYLLDTNIASAVLRGTPNVDARITQLDPAQLCISAITRAELRYGLALRPGAVKLAQLVDAFLNTFTTVPWDASAADHHGRLCAYLRARGTPIGDFDEMIAAHALSLGATLVTDNVQHFRRVDQLRIDNWFRPG